MSAFTIGALIVIGFLLLFFELFVPGGIIGLIGVVIILGALVAAGAEFGGGVVFPLGIACLLGVLGFFYAWFKYLPDSRLGRRVNLNTRMRKESGYTSQDLDLETLIGGRGEALSDLHPSGIAKIEGRRLDVVSSGAYITKGSPIVVSKVNSNRIVVKADREVSGAGETA